MHGGIPVCTHGWGSRFHVGHDKLRIKHY
ncbi:hypothetical protein PCAR4_390057 [Paraburkholderia caribensis]|nr:hypothetical protein PCAR4_390057 [Paraburkholderia caribensis]